MPRFRYADPMIATPFTAAIALQSPVDSDLSKLTWLSGCWAQRTNTQIVEEHWMAPGGGIMVGMSRTVMDGRTASFEQLRIAPMLSGTLAYIAQPSGLAAVTFPVKSVSDSEVVFENLAHDFPQRIIYRRNGKDGVAARIEGVNQGRNVGQDFAFKRCQ